MNTSNTATSSAGSRKKTGRQLANKMNKRKREDARRIFKRIHDRKPDTEAPDKNVNTCLAVVSSSGSAGEKR